MSESEHFAAEDTRQSVVEVTPEKPNAATVSTSPDSQSRGQADSVFPPRILDMPGLPLLRDAEQEAKDAVKRAIEKLTALKTASKVDMSNEFHELEEAMASISCTTATYSSTGTSRSASPTFESPKQPSSAMLGGSLTTPPRPDEQQQPCRVERRPMTDWASATGLPSIPPWSHQDPPVKKGNPATDQPVIEAFYRNLPSVAAETKGDVFSDKDFKDAHTNASAAERPQRVKINSSYLLRDLERISGINLPHLPHLMIPPYKLLIHNWDGIKTELQNISTELENLSYDVENVKTPDQPIGEKDHYEHHKPPGTQDKTNLNHQIPPTGPGVPTYCISTSPDEKRHDSQMFSELETRAAHLRCLYNFIRTDLGYLLGLQLKIQEGSLDNITFEELYYLYSPGDLIVDRNPDVDILYQAYAVTGGRIRLARPKPGDFVTYRGRFRGEADDTPDAAIGTWTNVVIDCFRMHWNGIKVGPINEMCFIQHYVGEKKVTDLEFYPIQFNKNSEGIRNGLMRRGRMVLDCHGHKKYDGLTAEPLHEASPRPPMPGVRPPMPGVIIRQAVPMIKMNPIRRDMEGDVYVDIKTFYERTQEFRLEFENPERVRPSPREVSESLGMGAEQSYSVGDHDVDEARSDSFIKSHFHLLRPMKLEEIGEDEDYLMLLPHYVPGYDFRQREWAWLDVNKVAEIDKSDESRKRGWDDLVINDGYRKLLLSLVNNHTSASGYGKKRNATEHGVPTSQIDLIKDKGRGLIVLLHGPPGTGKTSTAEAIAAYTGKPLYSITCGDIGTTASDVETNLREHTERAEDWRCVLLIDEADVFLTRRTWTDMDHNAVVSVLLRHLEYYSGILFLTTNIVGLIDEAFKSRIHIAVRYDPINALSTERIWNNILDRIIKDNESADIKIKFDRDVLLEFAQAHYSKHEPEETTWNARQIRNAFSMAISMGQSDRLERIRKERLAPDEAASSRKKSLTTIRLTSRNFSRIAEAVSDFEGYINAVRGPDGSNALSNQQRDDHFGKQPLAAQRKHRRLGDLSFSSRRQDSATMQTLLAGKRMKSMRKPADLDDEETIDEEGTSHGKESRMRGEEFSEDEDSDD